MISKQDDKTKSNKTNFDRHRFFFFYASVEKGWDTRKRHPRAKNPRENLIFTFSMRFHASIPRMHSPAAGLPVRNEICLGVGCQWSFDNSIKIRRTKSNRFAVWTLFFPLSSVPFCFPSVCLSLSLPLPLSLSLSLSSLLSPLSSLLSPSHL